jgi:hypothetical protein
MFKYLVYSLNFRRKVMDEEKLENPFVKWKMEKRQQWLKQARTPKDKCYRSLTFKIGEVLDRFGITGGARFDYYGFYRKAFRLIFRDVIGKGVLVPDEHFFKRLDRVFDYVEETMMEKYNLKPEIVKEIERVFAEGIVEEFFGAEKESKTQT